MIAEAMAEILDADLMEPQEAELVNLEQYDLVGGCLVLGAGKHLFFRQAGEVSHHTMNI